MDTKCLTSDIYMKKNVCKSWERIICQVVCKFEPLIKSGSGNVGLCHLSEMLFELWDDLTFKMGM